MSDAYEQLEIDTTLEADRSLKDNVQKVIEFAFEQIKFYDKPTPVRNRHEGYGIAAEQFTALEGANKSTKKALEDILKCLPNGEGDFIQFCGSLYAMAANTATCAIRLAAHAQRILKDLYDSESITPLQEYADGLEAGDGDFEDAGENESTPDEENAAEEDTAQQEEGSKSRVTDISQIPSAGEEDENGKEE